MKRYRFSDGHEITTSLAIDEVNKRMRRLDILRVLMEGYDGGEGESICRKALRAYNKEQFTGIIRLTDTEKDFLSYKLEDAMIDDEDAEVIRFYTGVAR
jgi:hypothetical protein